MADASRHEGSDAGSSGEHIVRRAKVNGRIFEFNLDGMITKGPSSIIGSYVCSEQLADIITESECRTHLFLANSPTGIRLARDEYRLAKLKEAHMQHGKFQLNQPVYYYGQHWTITATPAPDASDPSYALTDKHGKTLKVPAQRMMQEAKGVNSVPLSEQPNPYAFATQPQQSESQEVFEGSLVLDDKMIADVVQKKVDEMLESRMDEFLDKCAERIGRTIAVLGNEPTVEASLEADPQE